MQHRDQLTGPNEGYLAEFYEGYLKDPGSVGPQLRAFFQSWQPGLEDARPGKGTPGSLRDAQGVVGPLSLVQAIRDHGFMLASTDPLGLAARREPRLDPEFHGLKQADLATLPAGLVSGPLAQGAGSASELVLRLRQAYCGAIGYEFGHLRSAEEQAWFQDAVESGRFVGQLDAVSKLRVLKRLTQVEAFEQFLHRNFPGQKWFSLEGNDALIPVLDELVCEAAGSPVRTVVMGMAHRGRLNVLAHVLEKKYEDLLCEFKEGCHQLEDGQGSDSGWMRDVKYHLAARARFPAGGSKELSLVLLPNPSHLELVDPVVVGMVRAHQEFEKGGTPSNPAGDSALGILVHGDASFAGQGIVAETLNLQGLPGYRTGGTIHIIANNQIGFTTDPREAHSTGFCTDVARGYDVPVIHVNADDVEACIAVALLSFAYRQRFHKDIVIDLVGYRRYGHNEGDEPSFTQPEMYELIRAHPTARALWAEELLKGKVASPDQADEMLKEATARLREALEAISAKEPGPIELSVSYSRATRQKEEPPPNVSKQLLVKLNEELHKLPEGFTLNSKLERPFQRQIEALDGEGKIDWAHAESLALASLLAGGVAVRLVGQDTERGTFSQRHAVLHDAKTGQRFTPLQSLPGAKAPFSIYNSPLSEEAALGFEYGYSLKAGGSLVLWEAQYGDFVNNTQSMVDEFITSANAKWGQHSGLVLLLPHGYEGQGPDHSSAHLERFLQLAAEDNIQVVYCSTAAQYFHLLRRQAALLRSNPRPLVVMTAKSLLRHPAAMSSLQELTEGGFRSVIDDGKAIAQPAQVRRVVLCTGKIYTGLVMSDAYLSTDKVALVRLEELYPFPGAAISRVLEGYRNVDSVVWVQEEPQNRGAWSFVEPRLRDILGPRRSLLYIGRPPRSSAAEGSSGLHKKEEERIISETFSGTLESPVPHEVKNVR